MIIAFILIFFIGSLINKTNSLVRKNLTIIILLIYLSISFIDLIWLFQIEEQPFHPSDPTHYYELIRDISFIQIFNLESSNSFYLIINWILNQFWINPYWISIWVKIDNCLIAVFIYLLLTYNIKTVSKWDYILLFNPYMILTINRNVRDLYIILFVLIILIGLKTIQNRSISKYWIISAVLCLSITRIVLFAPIMAVWLYNKWGTLSKRVRLISLVFFVIITIGAISFLLKTVLNQMLSSMDFVGENIEDIMPILSGDISIPSVIAVVKRLVIAAVVFIFTPNPINFFNTWIDSMNATGASNIYTGFDNFLIFIGSIYNYIFVIPYIFYTIFNYKYLNKSLLLFTCIYSILYIVSYLGQTDIRNHNTAIFFFIACLMTSHIRIKLKPKEYLLSLVVCIGIGKS